MPIISEINPDPIINEIVDLLIDTLEQLKTETQPAKEKLKEIKDIAEQCEEKISFDRMKTLPEHLDERTELADVLETVKSLEHVLVQLLPGRVKYTLSQLREIKKKNNSEILRFISEHSF
jgi:hypothetical protein